MFRKKLFKSIALILSFVLLFPNIPVGAVEGTSFDQASIDESVLARSGVNMAVYEDLPSGSALLDAEKAWIDQTLNSQLAVEQQKKIQALELEQKLSRGQAPLLDDEAQGEDKLFRSLLEGINDRAAEQAIASERDLTERITRIKTLELERALAKQNEESAGRSLNTLAEELELAPEFIQELLDNGQTLEDIERDWRKPAADLPEPTIPLPRRAGLSVQESVYGNASVSRSVYGKSSVSDLVYGIQLELGGADQASAQMKSDVLNVDLKAFNTFRTPGLPPQPEKPKLDMLKVKLDEAPYRVEVEEESVSTVSGSLSLTQDDLTLPGRGGQGFTLTRTYDSGSSQLYDMDVSAYNYDYYSYYAVIDYELPTYQTYYTMTYNYRVLYNKYKCSTNEFVITESDYYSPPSPQTYTYNTSAERDQAWSSLPSSYESPGTDLCAQDRYYIYKYFRNGYTGSTTVQTGSYIESDYIGPYSTMAEAQSAAAQFGAGQSYNGGTIRSAGAEHVYLGSGTSYSNALKDADTDKRFPIGKGWTWNIPYLTFDGGTYLHMAGGGTYKVENGLLKGYPWKDLTLSADTGVTVNGLASAQVLRSITGDKTYFSADGRVIQMSDAYGNNTQFLYSSVSPYGNVLTKITDAIGNSISIAYTTSQVTLTMGDRVVTYKKTTQNNKELLSQVVDPMNRTTTYSYAIKSANFSLIDTNPVTNNPYALLTGVTHPTGAQTLYVYDTAPVTRYTGLNAVNQVFRVLERKDIVDAAAGTAGEANRAVFLYTVDMGSSYNQDMNFTSKVIRGSLESVFTYKKDFIDDQTAPMIYHTKLQESDLAIKRITDSTYDEVRRIPNPISVTTYYTNGTSESARVTTSTQYDDYGNVTSSTDALGQITTYTYDAATHLRTAEKWPVSGGLSLYVTLVRNAKGDVTDYQLKNAAAATDYLSRTTYTYDTYGNVTSTTDYDTARQALTTYEYDSALGSAFLTKQTLNYKDGTGAAKTSSSLATYNKQTGNMTSFTDANSAKTSYAHDKLDRITQITNPDNSTFLVAYNDSLNQVTTTNETGLQTRTTWDKIGRTTELAVKEAGAFKAKTRTGYDALSRVAWQDDPSGNKVSYTYDGFGRTTKTTNPDASFSTVVYNDLLSTVTDIDEENNRVERTYDKLGRVTLEKESQNGVLTLKQESVYDHAGNVTVSKDALGNITTYKYDLLGQLIGVTTPQSEVFTYSYDKLGNLITVQYPGNQKIEKIYDETGKLLKQVDESGQAKTMTYDLAGNLAQMTDRKGQKFTYTYDNRNRLLNRVGPNSTVTYVYEKDGKRKSMTDATGTTSYAYDPNSGLLTQKTYPDGRTLKSEYDLKGNRTKITDPLGKVTNYIYDKVNRLESVTTDSSLVASYTYLKNDRIKSVKYGNGMFTNYGYSGFDLTSVQHTTASGTVVNSYAYGYDNAGNLTTRTQNNVTHSYTYDKLGRVQTNSEFAESYTYDPRGNRSKLETVSQPELIEAAYEYDEWNRLKSAAVNGSNAVAYKYNGDDQLYERTENGVTTRYYWDEEQIVAEATVSGTTVTPKASYIYGNSLLGRIDGATAARSYYLLNGHQDVVELRDGAGAVKNKYTYDIWGRPLSVEKEEVSNPFRYASEYYDKTTGLYSMGQRWYDPGTGRFLQEDTFEGELKNPLSLNLYTYAHNDPNAYSDPSGNFAFLIPVAMYVAKAVVKTAVDTGVDYAMAKASGEKFSVAKSVSSNLVSNAIPGLGEAKSVSKALKLAKNVNTAKHAVKEAKAVKAAVKGTGKATGGSFKAVDATKGPDEVGHHIAQNAYNKTKGISRNEGPAVLMSKEDHAKTRTFAGKGKAAMREDTELGLNGRQRMAKDVWDVKKNFGSKYNEGLKKAIRYGQRIYKK
ncbi:RHS repeat-associated core domain-containing protein [Paenibacillus tepidiphilus]|uniref:RHS repeat-associated core domain-containing protein n=1 Tax=Paenibacillus tepidiphilus TaxID=2608683 RepID=UPI00123BE148|nr:RHS repeat-associated core domain-containing protein [Paenibacillus tepidiphilus]